MIMSVKMPSNGGENSKNRLEGMFDDRGIDRALEQPKKAEAPSLQEQVKAIRAEVQAAEQRAVDIGQRIITMAETSTNPRLQELKAQSEDLVQAIRSLNTDLLNVMLGEASIETVAKDAKTLTKATGSLFFEEQKQAAAMNEEQRLARSVAFREATEAAPAPEQAQIEPAAKPVATAEEMKPAEAGTEAAPAPETTTESKEYNRQSFWSELKQNMGDRSKAELPFRQTLKTIEKLEAERQQAEDRITESEKAEQTPEALIAEITKLHRSLGGSERAEEVKNKLEYLMRTEAGRNLFSHSVGPMEFMPMKRDLGKEGLAKRFAELKAEADKASKLGSLFEKMKALAGLSEFRVIESRKRQQEAALATLMDNLIELMQNKNKVASIDKRLDALNKEKESLSFQLGYDTEMFDMVERGDAITKDIENTERRLAQCLARMEDTPAKAKLKDGYPFPIPEELTHFLSPQQIDEYSKLAQHREELQQQLNAHIDETRQLFEGGVGGFTNRKIDEQMAKEAEVTTESIIEPEQNPPTENEAEDEFDKLDLGVSEDGDKDTIAERIKKELDDDDEFDKIELGGSDKDEDQVISERLKRELEHDKADQFARWEGIVQSDLAEKIAQTYPAYNDDNGYYQFVTQRLTKQGQDKIVAINNLKQQIDDKQTAAGFNRLLKKRDQMIEDFIHFISDAKNLKAPIEQNPTNEPKPTAQELANDIAEAKQAFEQAAKDRGDIEAYLPPTEEELKRVEGDTGLFHESLRTFIKTAHETFLDHTHSELLEHSKPWKSLGKLEDAMKDKRLTMRMDASEREALIKEVLDVYQAMEGHPYTTSEINPAAQAIDLMASTLKVDLKPLLANTKVEQNTTAAANDKPKKKQPKPRATPRKKAA